MAKCNYCGVEGLVWSQRPENLNYKLTEPEGEDHKCKKEDRLKHIESIKQTKHETENAINKYRDENGYL